MTYLGLLSATGFFFGGTFLATGEPVQGAFLLWGGFLFLAVAAQGTLTRVLVRRSATGGIRLSTVPESGESAVVIPYSSSLFWLMFTVPAVLFGIAGIVLIPLGGWALATQEFDLIVPAAIGVVGVVYAVAMLTHVCTGKLARGYVALSPTGIYHRSWALTSFVSWRHVMDVDPCDDKGPAIEVHAMRSPEGWVRQTSRLWNQPELAFAPYLMVRGMYLSVDPALVYHALQFYFSRPDARSELGDHAGVERLRRGDLAPSEELS
ncbi:hypothetical protein BJF78_19885 [Pseudonocardia sp. CNS-139]|nr:hypothetical protein BJF78_19885 [Pseudonocardia sp. CNS-139]